MFGLRTIISLISFLLFLQPSFGQAQNGQLDTAENSHLHNDHRRNLFGNRQLGHLVRREPQREETTTALIEISTTATTPKERTATTSTNTGRASTSSSTTRGVTTNVITTTGTTTRSTSTNQVSTRRADASTASTDEIEEAETATTTTRSKTTSTTPRTTSSAPRSSTTTRTTTTETEVDPTTRTTTARSPESEVETTSEAKTKTSSSRSTPVSTPRTTTTSTNEEETTTTARTTRSTSRTTTTTTTRRTRTSTEERANSSTTTSRPARTNTETTRSTTTRRTTTRTTITEEQTTTHPPTTTSHTTSRTTSRTTTTTRKSIAASPSATLSVKVQDLPCVQPPSTFLGREEGFRNLCKVRYCINNHTALRSEWDSNDGQLTRNEIETALGAFARVPFQLVNRNNSVQVMDYLTDPIENAGLVYEATGDIRFLDVAVRYTDNILATRNNPYNGTKLWSGEMHLLWPGSNYTQTAYAGSENGYFMGKMVSTANYILKSPCLWTMIPPAHNGPNSFSGTDTYLTRALAYVKAADETMKQYFLPNWFTKEWLIIQPNSTLYLEAKDLKNYPGDPMAWNRRTLLLQGIMKLAVAHETSPVADSRMTSLYDTIIERNMKDFLDYLVPTKASNGADTYLWYYVAHKKFIEEAAMGMHGFYDIYGMWWAWQRNSQRYGLNDTVQTNMVNTMIYTIWKPDRNWFSALVDGTDTITKKGRTTLKGGWGFYAYWNPEWYPIVVNATIRSLDGLSVPQFPFIFIKNARYENKTDIWKGQFSRGQGHIEGTGPNKNTLAAVLRSQMRVEPRAGAFLTNMNARNGAGTALAPSRVTQVVLLVLTFVICS